MSDEEINSGDGSGGCQRRQADTPVLVTSLVGPCAVESIFFRPGGRESRAFPNLAREKFGDDDHGGGGGDDV